MTARISLSAHGLCALLCVSRASPFAPGSAEPTACECTLPLACVRTCLGRSRVSRASDPRACRPWTCEWMIDIDRGRKVIRSRTVRGNQSSTRRHLHSVISPPRGGRTYVIAPREDMAFGRTYRRTLPMFTLTQDVPQARVGWDGMCRFYVRVNYRRRNATLTSP